MYPRVVDGGKLELEIDFAIQVASGEKARQDDAGELGLKTQFELRSGDTMILPGRLCPDSSRRQLRMPSRCLYC